MPVPLFACTKVAPGALALCVRADAYVCVYVRRQSIPKGGDVRRTVNSTDLSYSNPSPFALCEAKLRI